MPVIKWRRGRSRGPAGWAESRWGLLAVLLGAFGVVVGTAAQLVGEDDRLRPVWIGLLIAGAVLAAPALVLQSPWWRERWRAVGERIARHRADERHFETSGRGVLRPDWPGSYFTGRTRALRALVDFLDAAPADALRGAGVQDRVRVVVGQPGCGKSAVLGRLRILADPVRRREEKTPGPVPLVGVIDGAIHARGKDTIQILRSLTEYAGTTGGSTDPAGPNAALVDELLLALRNRCPPVTVVIDALDEAVEPEQVIREVIQPLVDGAAEVGIRLVLGLRRKLLRLLDVPAQAVIDLDDADYFERADMVEYALRCLALGIGPGVESPYRADAGYASKVAAGIADQAGQVFLIAQLTARALAHDAAVVDLASPAWRASFPSRVGTAMDALLARFADAARVRDLLVPLAFAEGSGLPPGPLWAALATALGTSAYTEQDVRWLLDSTPAIDLLQRVEFSDADPRYRLFHQALAEHLHTRSAHLAPHEAITRALVQGVVRTPAGERDWLAAHPYVRAHLATHAARCGHLGELLDDPGFLVAAQPDPLLRALPAVRDQQARRTAVVYRGVVHQLRASVAGQAAAHLELHARQQGHHGLAERVAQANYDQPWSTLWVRARPVHPHQVVGRHDGDVNTVVPGEIDGRLCVVAGDAAGEVDIWDLKYGTRLGEPIIAPAGEVTAVAVGQSPRGEAPVVVLGGDQGLWVANADGSGLRRVGTQTGVRCVAVTQAGGARVLVAGDVDGRIGMYDLTTGACRNAPFHAHAEGVQILVPAKLHGRGVVASGGTDGRVTVWDLTDGQVVTSLATAATEAVATLSLSTASQGPATVTVGGLDGIVRVWDLATGRMLATRVLDYDGWLNCLASAVFSGRPTVVGGAIDGRALVWQGVTDALPDPSVSEVTADAALAGHDGWISAVAAVECDDRDLIVTGGLDGTVRTWDLADADLLADRGDAHDGEVTTVSLLALPEARTVAVSGSTDGTVRLWRLADGGLFADPIPAHDRGVRVIATATLGSRAAIASGGNDGNVCVWDATTGLPLGDPVAAHTRTVRALVLLPLDDRPVLITGGNDGVRRWDPVSGTPIGEPLAAEQEIRAVAVTVARRPASPCRRRRRRCVPLASADR